MALDRPRFKIKTTILAETEQQFYFVLQSTNGEVVATSELYPTRQEARDAAKRARLIAVTATVGG